MKRIFITVCALAVLAVGALPIYAAGGASPGQDSCYYPISVEEYTAGETNEPRVKKVYQLSLADDPSGIPTDDFVRGGRQYYLLDMTRKDEVGVDTRPHTETVTQSSDTNNMETILQRLDAEMEVTTEDGYVGVLRLDHTTVQVTAKGYATKTGTVSATRTYPNLSEADLSLLPKTVEDKGKTLTLGDVKWSESTATDGGGNPVTRYTATASYTGTTSSKYATGYTVSANYIGEVAKTGCDVVTYTAVFGSMEDPNDTPPTPHPDGSGTEAPGSAAASGSAGGSSSNAPSASGSTDTPAAPKVPLDIARLKRPAAIGGLVIVLGVGGVLIFKKIRR